MPEIISRKEASARGRKRYFAGRPCVRGHIAERRVSTCQCLQCANIDKMEWARRNPEKMRAREEAYARSGARAAQRAKNRDKARQWGQAYQSKIRNLIQVLRSEMPELLKEFGL